MTPTADELRIGANAYERVRMHEKFGRGGWHSQWVVAIWPAIIVLSASIARDAHHRSEMAWLLAIGAACMYINWLQIKYRAKHYASYKLILRLLEEKYGNALPWVAEQKQLAAAAELEAAIKQGQPLTHT